MSSSPLSYSMPRHDRRQNSTPNSVGGNIVEILGLLDKEELAEIKRQLEKLDIDLDYCCEHPDVFCSILKIACGRSYVRLIRSIS